MAEKMIELKSVTAVRKGQGRENRPSAPSANPLRGWVYDFEESGTVAHEPRSEHLPMRIDVFRIEIAFRDRKSPRDLRT